MNNKTQVKLASIDQERTKMIKDLENKLGICLVAYENDESPFAGLSEDQLSEIRKMEEQTGLTLVAYQSAS
ncbi:MAG: hypothetical protein HOJ35_08960 [Bdellovibrionales bacterium]|jgi:hypothetical protein|nr:hypothetical protein [Bdellovibrionales bacterium]